MEVGRSCAISQASDKVFVSSSIESWMGRTSRGAWARCACRFRGVYMAIVRCFFKRFFSYFQVFNVLSSPSTSCVYLASLLLPSLFSSYGIFLPVFSPFSCSITASASGKSCPRKTNPDLALAYSGIYPTKPAARNRFPRLGWWMCRWEYMLFSLS